VALDARGPPRRLRVAVADLEHVEEHVLLRRRRGQTSIRHPPGTTARRFEGDSFSMPSQNVSHILRR
jgi:hypothetical protein